MTRLRWSRILLLLLVLWVGFKFSKNAWDNYQLKQEIQTLEKRLVVLEMHREELQREIAQWQLPENIERVAREELGLVMPGEVMYILSDPLVEDVERDVKKR